MSEDNVLSMADRKPKTKTNKPKDRGKPTSSNPNLNIVNIYERLANFTQDFPGVPRDHDNPFYSSKYFTIDDVWTAIKPYLKKHGLGILQMPSTIFNGEGVHPTLVTQVYCVGPNSPDVGSSEWMISNQFPLPVDKNTGQGVGMSITYMRRYCMVTMLNITDFDDDGQSGEEAGFSVASDAAKETLVKLVDQTSDKDATIEWIKEKYDIDKDQDYIDFLNSARISSLTKLLADKLAK